MAGERDQQLTDEERLRQYQESTPIKERLRRVQQVFNAASSEEMAEIKQIVKDALGTTYGSLPVDQQLVVKKGRKHLQEIRSMGVNAANELLGATGLFLEQKNYPRRG